MRWQRLAIRTAAGSLGLVGLLGLLHLPVFRPQMVRWGLRAPGLVSTVGCPLGFDRALPPDQRVRARRSHDQTLRGSTRALTRPALRFELDRMTRPEVERWATEAGVRCHAGRGSSSLECEKIEGSLLGRAGSTLQVSSAWFDFAVDGTLQTVRASRRTRELSTIQLGFSSMSQMLSQRAGPPSQMDSEDDVQRLSGGALRQVSAEFRFRDYYAVVRATNMGQDYLLTEEYRSLAL